MSSRSIGVMYAIDEWILSWLNQRTHSAVSRSTSRSPDQFRARPVRVMHSVLYSPIVDSIRALSSASPIVPIDPAIPAAASSSVNASAVYCFRMVQQTGGRELDVHPAAGEQCLLEHGQHQRRRL